MINALSSMSMALDATLCRKFHWGGGGCSGRGVIVGDWEGCFGELTRSGGCECKVLLLVVVYVLGYLFVVVFDLKLI